MLSGRSVLRSVAALLVTGGMRGAVDPFLSLPGRGGCRPALCAGSVRRAKLIP
jgi:hypothetical protein